MAIRFRKSKKLLPGVRLNVGKKSVGVRIGGKNAGISLGTAGKSVSASIPKTGLGISSQSRKGCFGAILAFALGSIVAVVAGGWIGHARADEWLCVAQQATGFKWLNERWTQTNFTVEGDSFVVAEVEPHQNFSGGETVGVEVTHLGDDYPRHNCPPFFAEDSEGIACGGLGYGFVFNRKALRFQEYYGLGYVDGEDAPGNTPSITIGTCTKLPPRD